MRATGGANRVDLRHLQHGGLNISDGYCTDDRPAFVTKDIRLAFADADHKAAATINIGDILVSDD